MTKLRLPPPNILSKPARIDAWFYRLSPNERGVYLAYLNELVKQLPPQKKSEFSQRLNRIQGSVIQGVGGWISALIGAAGAVTSATVSSGASIYMGKEQQELQKELAAQSGMYDLVGQQVMADTEKQIQQILSDAQIEAARTAAGAQVGTAKEMANAMVEQALIEAQRDVTISQGQQSTKIQVAESTWGKWGKWATVCGLSLVGLVVVGGLLRKRRKKSALSP